MNNLTEEEVMVLAETYNLADGHAFRRWNRLESVIIDNVATIFHKVDRRYQQQIEAQYIEAFFELSKQSRLTDYFKMFLCFTASTALEVVANYFRIKKLSVSLIEPCFDNLHDILLRQGVPLTSFPEHLLESNEELLLEYLQKLTTDAIFLVSPNNPSGKQIRKKNFQHIIEYCSKKDKILVLDTCFRFYLPEDDIYDHYKILADHSIKCVLIEDTGKTWPTLELKAPFFSVSPQLMNDIGHIYSDFLLHVSPVSVVLLTKFLQLPNEFGLGFIQNVVSSNRRALYHEIDGSFLEPEEASFMSVAWLKILCPVKSSDLKARLSDQGIHVLPGNQFFWSDPEKGNKYIRLALNREPEMFQKAASKLGQIVKSINHSQYE